MRLLSPLQWPDGANASFDGGGAAAHLGQVPDAISVLPLALFCVGPAVPVAKITAPYVGPKSPRRCC